jgi:hypothetical protein
VIDLLLQLRSVQNRLRQVAGWERPLTAGEVGILLDIATEAEVYIQTRWPVRTGASRDAWQVRVQGLALRFVNDTDYAEHVHWQGEGPDALWDALYEEVLEEVIDPGILELLDAIDRSQPTQLLGIPTSPSLQRAIARAVGSV